MLLKKWIVAPILGGLLFANLSDVQAAKAVDLTPPAQPTINAVSDKTVAITGKAESKAKVFAYVGSKRIGEATAKSGKYSIKINKQKAGTSIKIFAMDASKNKSIRTYTKVIDKTAPTVSMVNNITNTATAITGKAESNSKVYAYIGNKKLGEAIAKNGKYKITVKKQKAGTSIRIYAVDAAKNKSTSKTVKVIKASSSVKYTVSANVNMRASASTSAKVLTVLPKGTMADYISKTGTWYKVKTSKYTGYVSSSYLKKVVADENPATYPAPSTKTPGTYKNGILLVNKQYSLPSTYNPGVNETAQKGVNAMVEAAKKQGVYLNPFSTFRSYSRQETLYTNYVNKYGKVEAEKFSARPGQSEHQTGLAFDFGGGNQAHWLEESFGTTTEGKWLAANAHKYGFILRYPKGKEKVTGYQYEPWHFRYVGSAVAAKVKESGLTLEEYLKTNNKK